MPRYIAFDVETPNRLSSRMSAIGITVIENGNLMAHHAVFDMRVLKSCLQDYSIRWKHSAPCLCTVQMGKRILPGMRHKLDALCDFSIFNVSVINNGEYCLKRSFRKLYGI